MFEVVMIVHTYGTAGTVGTAVHYTVPQYRRYLL